MLMVFNFNDKLIEMFLCCALNCKNRGVHLFPKESRLRKQWKSALHIKNFKATKSARLCSAHFKEEDYYHGKRKGYESKAKFLKRSAVPSVFCYTEAKPDNPEANHHEAEQQQPSTSRVNTSTELTDMDVDQKEIKLKSQPLQEGTVSVEDGSTYRKCFVPICPNTTENCPDKIFVRIRQDMRVKWCKQVNTKKYNSWETRFCCEDHFDRHKDLKDYFKRHLLKEEHQFKTTALLRYIAPLEKMELKSRALQKENVSNNDVTAPASDMTQLQQNKYQTLIKRKCFVPTCPNTTENCPEKLFVRIREDLKKKWCDQVNAEFYTWYSHYCCDDHFDRQEDLKDYFKRHFQNKEHQFKPTALLRNIPLEKLEKDLQNFQKWRDNSAYPIMSSTATLKCSQSQALVCDANVAVPSTLSAMDAQVLMLQNDLENYDTWRKHGGYPIMSANATLKAFTKLIASDSHKQSTSATNFHMEISQPKEESTSVADEEGECPLLEEEIWADLADPPPCCSECAGEADGGKLYQCVECPRFVCADCERADKHPLHCMLRLPSLNVYNIMKDLFESLREAVTTKLVLNDDQPGYPPVEPKTEPIFEDQVQDPLSPIFSDQTSDHNDQQISKENPLKSKQILVTSRTIKSLTQAPSTGSPKPKSKVLSAFETTEPTTAGTDEWNVTVKRKKEDNGDTQKPLIIVKKKKITNFEVPLKAKTHEPLTTTSHKPSTTISHKPSTNISHKPLKTIAHKPVTVTKHKPLTTVVGKPLATTAPKPLATKVHKTLTTIVDKPLTTIVDKPLITIKLEPLETEEIVVKSEAEIKLEDTAD